MAGFKCPFCGQFMCVGTLTKTTYRLQFHQFASQPYDPSLTVVIYRCPNDLCKEETVIVYGGNGYVNNIAIPIYPESTAVHFPDYIPQSIRSDYEGACSILHKSPKASATLSRRCLQGMIRDFCGIKKNRLVDEFQELQDKVPASQWAAIDALRGIGNIGAHMEKDVNLIIDVSPEEADSLIRMIELLLEKWYVNRHDEEELYQSIVRTKESKHEVKTTNRSSPSKDQNFLIIRFGSVSVPVLISDAVSTA